MGLAGAEKALCELLRSIPADAYNVSVLALIDRGELFAQLPATATLLNKHPSRESVLGVRAERFIAKRVLRAAFAHGSWLRNLLPTLREYRRMKRDRRVQKDKLFWRILSDGAPRFRKRFDLAVAYLEGGATYYVADHVNAARKLAFVHIDYVAAGYTPALDRGCYDAFASVCVVSKEVGEKFVAVHPEQQAKVRLFHNLLDVENIRRLADSGEGFADGFTGKRLLSIGRLHPQKAYPTSIEVMKRLTDAGRDLRWYVLGEGAERPALEALIHRQGLDGRFVLLGAKQNPYPYLKQADLYIHTTRFEGKSIAIEEAQALGKAIVASDCTGNREQIVNEVNGLLVPLEPEAIAEAIGLLLDHPDEAERLARQSSYQREDRQKDVQWLLEQAEEASA